VRSPGAEPANPAASGKTKEVKEGKPAAPREVPEGKRTDAFVRHTETAAVRSGSEARLDDAFAQAHSMSGIENLVRLLESTRGQLLREHDVLHLEAQRCVELLSKTGFSEAQLATARAELAALRLKMQALRKRLQHLRRRLRSTHGRAGKTADANLGKALSEQLHILQAMEPGMSRALGALSVIEQAYGSFSDGSQAVFRTGSDGDPAPELVTTLAPLAPGAVVSQVLSSMITGQTMGQREGQTEGQTEDQPTLAADANRHDTAVGLAAFADALLGRTKGDKEGA
jgi:hypothetical protein